MIFRLEEAFLDSQQFVPAEIERKLSATSGKALFPLVHLMYLMFAFAIRGAGTKPAFMHDKSPVINFFRRLNRLLIFARFASLSAVVSFDGWKLVRVESANVEITTFNWEAKCNQKFVVSHWKLSSNSTSIQSHLCFELFSVDSRCSSPTTAATLLAHVVTSSLPQN